MIVEYIRYTVTNPDALVHAYETASRWLDASPHCHAYELSRCREDASCFMLRIEWDSIEGHLDGFRKSAEFGGFLAAVRPFMSEIIEMRHYELTQVHSRKTAA